MKTTLARSDVAILIPIYKMELSESEIFSIKNTVATFPDRDVLFVGPKNLATWLEYYALGFNGAVNGVILFDNKFFASVDGYNKLMMSRLFYATFDKYRYILITQLDALVFSDCLDHWVKKGYSYVGAPWFCGFDNPVKPLKFLGVGNGGLSLRCVRDFVSVLAKPRRIPNFFSTTTGGRQNIFIGYIKHILHNYIFAYNFSPLLPRLNEDLFWGILISSKFAYFRVPPPDEAIYFAFEVEPEYSYKLTCYELPFGCHAWEKYNYNFWKSILLSNKNIHLP